MAWTIRRVVRTIDRTIKRRGVVGSVLHVATAGVARIRRRGGAGTDGDKDPAAERIGADVEEDVDFDTKYGVDTGGEIAQTDLDVKDKTWIHGSAYVPTSPVAFAQVLAELDIPAPGTTFMDLGSGKGRVLLMAAALPWKRVIGVEFSPSLADISRDNVKKYTGPKECTDIVVETADATKYPFPSGPVVVFMYHPFDETIMAAVAASLTRSYEADRRDIYVLYFKPVHRAVWDNLKGYELIRDAGMYTLYKARS